MGQEILWNWDSTEGVASLNRKAMPSQGNASKAKSVQKQSIGEAKVSQNVSQEHPQDTPAGPS